MNLYNETIEKLDKNGKNVDDIIWVGCDDFSIPLDNFLEVSKRTDYDNGYGSPEIATDLKIVGNDFIMVRNEYDGSEWWDFIAFNHKKT